MYGIQIYPKLFGAPKTLDVLVGRVVSVVRAVRVVKQTGKEKKKS